MIYLFLYWSQLLAHGLLSPKNNWLWHQIVGSQDKVRRYFGQLSCGEINDTFGNEAKGILHQLKLEVIELEDGDCLKFWAIYKNEIK